MATEEELTPAQKLAMDALVEKWGAIGLSTGQGNEPAIEAAILKAYTLAGHPHPDEGFKWFDSPKAASDWMRAQGVKEAKTVWGVQDAAWLAYIEAMRVLNPGALPTADGLIEAAENGAGWYWPFNNICVVSRRMKAIHWEANRTPKRLHALEEPALLFEDGWGLSLIKGNRVTEDIRELCLHPENMTKEDILNQTNTEVRRVMMEAFGVERLIKFAERVSEEDRYGCLYRFDVPTERGEESESVMMLKMVNSTAEPDGTFKVYIERVPPTMTTPLEAQAWRFNVTQEEYARIEKET